ncbi:MAG: CGNR zinc finger domain-containing protein [Steroidobacteraceae bacterium]
MVRSREAHARDSYAATPPQLVAGTRCLDFLNTVEWRGRPGAQEERLTSYGEFIHWAAAAGLLDRRDARRLRAIMREHPAAAASVLREAIAAREALAILLGDAAGSGHALRLLRAVLDRSRYALALAREGKAIRARWKPAGPVLRRPLLELLREAIALLESPKHARIRSCANDECGWYYLDSSRNQSRRWCRMQSCGNQAKARAHYRRQRSG